MHYTCTKAWAIATPDMKTNNIPKTIAKKKSPKVAVNASTEIKGNTPASPTQNQCIEQRTDNNN